MKKNKQNNDQHLQPLFIVVNGQFCIHKCQKSYSNQWLVLIKIHSNRSLTTKVVLVFSYSLINFCLTDRTLG